MVNRDPGKAPKCESCFVVVEDMYLKSRDVGCDFFIDSKRRRVVFESKWISVGLWVLRSIELRLSMGLMGIKEKFWVQCAEMLDWNAFDPMLLIRI